MKTKNQIEVRSAHPKPLLVDVVCAWRYVLLTYNHHVNDYALTFDRCKVSNRIALVHGSRRFLTALYKYLMKENETDLDRLFLSVDIGKEKETRARLLKSLVSFARVYYHNDVVKITRLTSIPAWYLLKCMR
jgi:hypothetical protein